MIRPIGFVASVVAVLAVARLAFADATARDPAQETALDSTLRVLGPSKVETFHAGNEAMDRGDYSAAVAAYRNVHEAAPGFVAATRRLCTAEARSGDAPMGVRHCREALAAEASPENHAALAVALLNLGPSNHGELEEATKEASEAVKLAPEKEFAQLTACQVSYQAADLVALDRCSGALFAIDRDAATTHFFAAVSRYGHHDFSASRAELEKAKSAGIDSRLYETQLRQLRTAEQLLAPTPPQRILLVLERMLEAWAAGLALLFGVGGVLSLRVERGGQLSAALRRGYAAVVTLAALYFYLSLAVLVVATAAAVAAFAYSAFPLGQATFLKVVAVSSVIVYAAMAIARAATTYDDDESLGASVSLAEESKLRALLDEVAASVLTRPVDTVYVVEGTSLEIADRGGAFAHLRGRSERALVLGIEWLGDAKLRLLRAGLARQYGQWRRRGAAGGSVALAMRRALRLGLEENRSRLNPARWLLCAWSALYDRVSRGAAREQERLVGRWVEHAYGAGAEERDDDELAGRTLVVDRAAIERSLPKTGDARARSSR